MSSIKQQWRYSGLVFRLFFGVLMIGVCVMLVSNWRLEAKAASAQFKTDDESNTIDVFKSASPSVVYVTNKGLRRDFFSLNVHEIPQGTGSGFVWDQSGIIVTNFHVIRGAARIEITLTDQTTWDAELVGVAPDKDLAVLRIDAPQNKLQPLPIGDSNRLEVGRKVLAIGNPFGLDTTLTVGVVSALGREIDAVTGRTIKNVIQTDAAINPGNSGGPLLNSLGQLVAVNTAIYSPSGASVGIGFAIPVNTVNKIVPQLIKYGKLFRPVLGVELVPDNWAMRAGINGVVIMTVSRGLPADRAGLQGIRRDVRTGEVELGDIIIGIEGQAVKNSDDLLSELEEHKPGETVSVTIKRGRQIITVDVVLAAPQ